MARKGFNATARARAREEGPVTLGDVEYRPARLTNAALTEINRLSEETRRRNEAIIRETDDYRERLDELMNREVDPLSQKDADEQAVASVSNTEVGENNAQNAAAQLARLLLDPEGKPTTEEQMRKHIDEDIDSRDLGPLLDYLLGPDEDPTVTSASPETPATA